jgi:capsid protein
MFLVINKNGVISNVSNQTQMTGEKIPGDLDSWKQFSTDPNVILRYSYNILSERSTSLYHTHPPIAAAIEKHVQYAIGPGLVFRSQPDWEILGMTKPTAKAWGMKLQKLIHYAFLMLNFYEKQSIIFRTAYIQGDSLLLFDRKEPVDGLPFDLIETGGDQIDCDKDINTKDNRQVRLGIETDKYLRRKGIWQRNTSAMIPFEENGFQNVIQFFERKIARQLRGYPLAYRLIASAKNNDRMWDAMLQRMAIEASIIGVEKSDANDMNVQAKRLAEEMRSGQVVENEIGVNPSSSIRTEGNVQKLGSGNIFSLKKGGEFNWLEMKTPGNNFTPGQESYYQLVGMGTNTPPEVVKSLYSTSYTAHMGALNDFKKAYMKERQGFLNCVNNVVIKELTKFFIVNGMLDNPNPAFFSNPIMQRAAISGKWLGPVPGTINPSQEATAMKTKVDEAMMLRSDAAALNENEWDNFIEEWAEEERVFNESSPLKQVAAMKNDIEKYKEGADNEDDSNDDTSNDKEDDNKDNKEVQE